MAGGRPKKGIKWPGHPPPGKDRPTIRDRGKVIEMTCAGFNQEEIARYFKMDPETLRKYYADELQNSYQMRKTKLMRLTYRAALAGCRHSREFWLTTKGGMYKAQAPEKTENENKAVALLESINKSINK